MADFWLKHRGEFPSLETCLSAFNWARISDYGIAASATFLSEQFSWGVPSDQWDCHRGWLVCTIGEDAFTTGR